MALLITTAGQNLLLQWALCSTSQPEDLTLHLYTNNYTPTAADTTASYTEATFTGYSAMPVARATWGAPATNSTGQGEADYPQQTWTVGSSQTIYGYWIQGVTSGTVVWAEAFATPRPLQSGDTFRLTPSFTLQSQ